MGRAKRLKRELTYQGKIIGLYQDTLELEDGKVVQYDFINHNGATAIVPVTKDGKILMVRQYRNAVDRETLEIPAGKREGDEDPKECARRELEEETGYSSDNLELLLTLDTWVAFCNERIDVYVAQNLEVTQQNLDEDEFIDVEAWRVEDLVALILQGKIKDAKTAAAIMAYKVKYL